MHYPLRSATIHNVLFLAILIIGSGVLAGPSSAADQPIDFAHDILPILRDRCAKCHTGETRKGGVSIETREAVLESGIAVVGESAESTLIERITSDDPELRMPLEDEQLSEKEIVLLRRWIDGGMQWQEGFSFAPVEYVPPLEPRRPKLPDVDGVEHPIDRLLAAYFNQHEIEFPPPADDAVFVRRAYLDLIGLLPTPSQVDAFVHSNDADKHKALILELLNDERAFAEHWFTFWNDLLRNDYTGTGYIDGGRKQITRWLYQSLLENKPYDQFVHELLSPSEESEGFIRGIKWRGNVNASQQREVQFAQTTSQVFLGINMKCASCHDSFIDHWKLADAYGLAAIISDEPLEMHRCDKPTGVISEAKFIFPELGSVDPSASKEDRLDQFAKLMTHQSNGRFARTIVNRLWHRLMGRGIVHPVDVMSNRPWDEDLLDYLGSHLADNEYDLKSTLELIGTSRIYRAQVIAEESEPTEGGYVFRGLHGKRMTAEQFMDAVWSITDRWPDEAAADFGDRGETPVRAALVHSDLLMRSLGRPNREQVVTTRPEELTTLQALDLSNGEILSETLQRGAANLLKKYEGESAGQLGERIFRRALGRVPDAAERSLAVEITAEPPNQDGVADLLWAVFMLPEFQIIR